MALSADQKKELQSYLLQASGLDQEQKSILLGLLNERKRYGLVWEDKPEDAYEKLRTELPVFTEVPERRIVGASPDSPDHILIEGDNLHALTALQYTHAGKVDVIYIDPPYNTGENDFSYNDSYVDKEDEWRHSKWQCFIEKRLKLAKLLLKETGTIFVSIDERELGALLTQMNELFGDSNREGVICWRRRHNQPNDKAKMIGKVAEFIIAFSKNSSVLKEAGVGKIALTGKFSNPDNDPRGDWSSKPWKTGSDQSGTSYVIVTPGGVEYDEEWMGDEDSFKRLLSDNRILFPKNGKGSPRKKYFKFEREEEGQCATNWWSHEDSGHNQGANDEMTDIFQGEKNRFSNPKPSLLISKVIQIASISKSSLILDFFAGSGTTLHATMALNAEDGGKRQCILVTNNENDICEKVTYERNKRVIQGYTNAKGQAVEGLVNNTLRYYKTEFVPREPTLKNRREFVKRAVELIAIKENAFHVRTDLSGPSYTVIEAKNAFAFVVADPDAVPDVVDCIRDLDKPCKVYVFSPGNYAWDEDFEEVRNKVELIPMPEAVYAALENELPKRSLVSEAAQ